MNKAILVIDMPDSCGECPLFCGSYVDMCCHGLNNRGINYPYPENFRQDWCPLRSLPEKYDMETAITRDFDYDGEFEYGYNTCIDEILGDQHE